MPLAVLGFLIGIGSSHPVSAQTFDQANTTQLQQICTPRPSDLGPNLTHVCKQVQAGKITSVAGAGAQSPLSMGTFASAQQLHERLEEESKTGSGGSADTLAVNLGGGFSAFLSAGAESLRHHPNSFEEGYTSTIPAVTLGADYRVTDWFVTGAAFNYYNWNGNFDSGGGFNVNSYGSLLYMNFLPFDGAFADVVLSYARQNNSRNRQAEATDKEQTNVIVGLAPGNPNTNQYRASILTGYDYPIANFTIGPRFGLDAAYWQVDSYQEHGNTGLELSYRGLNVSSVQSGLGVTATRAISTPFGSGLLQLTAVWVHEFANDARIIHAKFVEAPNSSEFTFQRAQPARNWAVINLGVSVLTPNGLQPFVNFGIVQGNQNFSSYGGNVGLRVDW